MSTRPASGWRLAAGGWRLAAGGWRLAAGGWRLAAGGWRLAAEGTRIARPPVPMKHGARVIAFIEDPNGYKIELLEPV